MDKSGGPSRASRPRRLIAEAGVVLFATVVAVVLSVMLHARLTDESIPSVIGRPAAGGEDAPRGIFEPTGEFLGGESSAPLVVHSLRVTHDYIAVAYTLVGSPENSPKNFDPLILDDAGHTYRTKTNAILGISEGVLAGILVTEGYIPGGSVLSIEARQAQFAAGVSSGMWSIPFVLMTQPNSQVNFVEGGRLSREEGVTINGATVGIAGPPGGPYVEVLITRGDRAVNFLGIVDGGGMARATSPQEFRELTGVSEFPKPPTFPWPLSPTE